MNTEMIAWADTIAAGALPLTPLLKAASAKSLRRLAAGSPRGSWVCSAFPWLCR